jgi:large subunit ribosomal protein L2
MGKRLLQRRRGAKKSISPSHRHRGDIRYPPVPSASGRVVDLMHAPGRTTPLAKVELDGSRERLLMIAAEGLKVGQTIVLGEGARVETGSVLPLRSIPIGAQIFNIESRPGDGGKFARAGGQAGTLVSAGERPVVQLPSGQFRSFEPDCRATIGRTAGSGHQAVPMYKAGKKYHSWRSTAKRYPRVRGVAMNPVDHPHGGGSHQHVGRPSTVSSRAPPGRKVGRLSPKRKDTKHKWRR